MSVPPAVPVRRRPRLEPDELWSFVGCKARKGWLWLAVDRDPRRVVARVLGGRGVATARRRWRALPAAYRRARCFTDAWAAYAAVVPATQHRGGRKGRTNLVEGVNCWLRQRCAVLVRKGCAFSKCLKMHHVRIKLAIYHYNLTAG